MNSEYLSFVLKAVHPGSLVQKYPSPLQKPVFTEDPESWKHIFAIAQKLQATLPLSNSLSRVGWFSELPKTTRLMLEERIQREKLILSILDHELDSALFLLSNANIPVIILKGMEWGYRYYPERFMRPVSDLDLLVPQKNFSDTLRVLERGGYSFTSAKTQHQNPTPLSRAPGGPTLWLYESLFEKKDSSLDDQIWQRAVVNSMPSFPSHVSLLSHEDNLIFMIRLCTAQHLLQSPVHLNDLHFLIETPSVQENLDWDWLNWFFAHQGLSHAAWFVFQSLINYCGTKIPKDAFEKLCEQIGHLKKHLLARLTHPSLWFSNEKRGLPWTMLSQILLKENIVDALKISFRRDQFKDHGV